MTKKLAFISGNVPRSCACLPTPSTGSAARLAVTSNALHASGLPSDDLDGSKMVHSAQIHSVAVLATQNTHSTSHAASTQTHSNPTNHSAIYLKTTLIHTFAQQHPGCVACLCRASTHSQQSWASPSPITAPRPCPLAAGIQQSQSTAAKPSHTHH